MDTDRDAAPLPRIRAVRDEDADAVIRLIARCFADYPGCILDCDHEETELKTPGTSFPWFWVAETAIDGEVIGCVGCKPGDDVDDTPGVELKKLYVHPDARRAGIGRALVATVEATARTLMGTPSPRVFLWSDVRFVEAHHAYERLGYRRGPQARDLSDVSRSVEFRFARDLPAPREPATGG